MKKKTKQLKMGFKSTIELGQDSGGPIKTASYDPIHVVGPTKEVLRTEHTIISIQESAEIIPITGGVNVNRQLIVQERVSE